jgi:hypothetical protein
MSNKQQCPEFPYFGAKYPDATCINGSLWDLDKCNEDGTLYGGGDDPCPFCNTESAIEHHDDGEPGSREKIAEDIQKLKEKYDYHEQ